MQSEIPTYTASNCQHDRRFIPKDNGLGELFRDFGEKYISSYRPSEVQIKMIRSIRVCKTPALGGTIYECRSCKNRKYVYFGCGNSRCPKCQGIKRMQWQDRISRRLFQCPYVHMVFTMPHLLNHLARSHPAKIYNCLMRSAWSSLLSCAEQSSNLGARPGAIMVLHTFGSDLKYHVHVHVLVSFGGMDDQGQWSWPKRKNKIIPFRQIRRVFRTHFCERLQNIYPELDTRQDYADLKIDLMKKSWCVHAEPPTMQSHRIKDYLGKYICRIGLSKRRFNYDSIHREVTLQFKDYRNKSKQSGLPQMAVKKMHPLVAINQILQHCLPRYFQKCRYLGLHANACQKKYQDIIPKRIRNNCTSIRTLFEILHAMLGLEGLRCEFCKHNKFDTYTMTKDSTWLHTWLKIEHNVRGSPHLHKYRPSSSQLPHGRQLFPCNKTRLLPESVD